MLDKIIFPTISKELLSEIEQKSEVKLFPKGMELLKENQYIRALPILLKGLIKVYSYFEDRELLLYYIEPNQSCVMTFYSALRQQPSRIHALTEENCEILLLPAAELQGLLNKYPDFNELFYDQFNLRYMELLDTIRHLLVNRMDKRLLDHLWRKIVLSGRDYIKISHVQLANELGTAREVVSRVLKKLEAEEKIDINHGIIRLKKKYP
jgi:CRP/FNR family transcriptional regulator